MIQRLRQRTSSNGIVITLIGKTITVNGMGFMAHLNRVVVMSGTEPGLSCVSRRLEARVRSSGGFGFSCKDIKILQRQI